MDWRDLERLIKDERKAGNPVAQLIHSLQVGAWGACMGAWDAWGAWGIWVHGIHSHGGGLTLQPGLNCLKSAMVVMAAAW